MVSLAGAIVLGPRIGRIFLRDDKKRGGLPAAHSLPLATIGAFLLWFGWYGFNPGSTLSAMDYEGIGRVAANTTLAACTGSLAAMLAALWIGPFKGKFDTGFALNGMLAGLVAITAPCYWVSPFGSVHSDCVYGCPIFCVVMFVFNVGMDCATAKPPLQRMDHIHNDKKRIFFMGEEKEIN